MPQSARKPWLAEPGRTCAPPQRWASRAEGLWWSWGRPARRAWRCYWT